MKLTGQHIVIFSLFRFDSEIESTGYTLAKYLAKDNFVYYVDNPFTINDLLKRRKTEQYARRRNFFSPFSSRLIDTELPNLKVVITPLLLSINFLREGGLYRRLLKVNEYMIRLKLRRVLKSTGIQDFIFINSFNFHYPDVADGLAPGLTVYHCLDPVMGVFDGRHGIVSEERLVRKSDLVICSSRQLFNDKVKQNSHTYFIPNAADLKHSAKALDPSLPVSSLLASIPKPVIGYFGVIEERMNFVLMKEVIQSNPDKSFVFVGPTSGPVPEWYYTAPNVFFTGGVPYREMPSIIKGFDVALIPFRKDERSATVFPLKLFEYLGAGKPVVATDFNMDLAEFTADTVAFCPDAGSFSQAISDALASNTDADVAKRIALAGDHTWEKRVEAIADLLYQYKSIRNSAPETV